MYEIFLDVFLRLVHPALGVVTYRPWIMGRRRTKVV